MKSIDKLRELLDAEIGEARPYFKGVAICDEIEAEIAERYMELPVDADGAPIHVGDMLECHANGYEGTFTVFAIGKDTVVGNHDIEWIRDNPSKWFHVASYCHHVKPRTLEDALEDCINEFSHRCTEGKYDTRPTVAKYADEIREMFGGDEGGVVKR